MPQLPSSRQPAANALVQDTPSLEPRKPHGSTQVMPHATHPHVCLCLCLCVYIFTYVCALRKDTYVQYKHKYKHKKFKKTTASTAPTHTQRQPK
jgi:hypothetical protein